MAMEWHPNFCFPCPRNRRLSVAPEPVGIYKIPRNVLAVSLSAIS
jgi:hypothetical protein